MLPCFFLPPSFPPPTSSFLISVICGSFPTRSSIPTSLIHPLPASTLAFILRCLVMSRRCPQRRPPFFPPFHEYLQHLWTDFFHSCCMFFMPLTTLFTPFYDLPVLLLPFISQLLLCPPCLSSPFFPFTPFSCAHCLTLADHRDDDLKEGGNVMTFCHFHAFSIISWWVPQLGHTFPSFCATVAWVWLCLVLASI